MAFGRSPSSRSQILPLTWAKEKTRYCLGIDDLYGHRMGRHKELRDETTPLTEGKSTQGILGPKYG